MKLVSWNIWKGTHLEKVVDELGKLNADVICLQEVKEDQANQAEKIAIKLKYNFVYFPIFITDRHTPSYTLGNAILTRYTIANPQHIYLSDLSNYTGNSTAEPRGAIKARIGKYTVICTHLGFSKDLVSTQIQIAQLNNLLPLLKSSKLILAGDFNSIPDSKIIKKIEEILINSDNSSTPTRNALKEGEEERRIDYIFTSPDIKIKRFKIQQTSASDHNILIATL